MSDSRYMALPEVAVFLGYDVSTPTAQKKALHALHTRIARGGLPGVHRVPGQRRILVERKVLEKFLSSSKASEVSR